MRYDQIRPGTYTGTVTGTALGKTSSGKEQIGIGFDVHVSDPETGAPCSVPMTYYCYFHTDGALRNAMKSLAALGFDMATRGIEELAPEDAALSPLVGAEAEVVLENEDDQDGNPRLRIKWVNRAGGGLAMKERMEPAEAKSFSAQLRAKVISARGPGAAPAAPPARPAAPAARKPVAAPKRSPAPAAAPASENDWSDIPF